MNGSSCVVAGMPVGVSDGVTVLRNTFLFQSGFGQLALQSPNEPIISSTLLTRPAVRGKMVGLHPTSQTPVAVRLLGGQTSRGTTTLVLSPGQIVRVKGGGFEGIEWGLPFGWLGGGVAQLVIANNEDAFLGWSQQKVEVCYYRTQIPIQTDNVNAAVSAANWPNRLPWSSAIRGGVNQGGAPLIGIENTRVVMRLVPPGAVGATPIPPQATQMRLRVDRDDTLDLGISPATGFLVPARASYVDVTWPGFSALVDQSLPLIEMTGPFALLGGDSAALTLLDPNIGAPLSTVDQGFTVHLYRFGRI